MHSNFSKMCGNKNESKIQSAPNSCPATLITLGGEVVWMSGQDGRRRPGMLSLRRGGCSPLPGSLVPSFHDKPSFITSGFSSLLLWKIQDPVGYFAHRKCIPYLMFNYKEIKYTLQKVTLHLKMVSHARVLLSLLSFPSTQMLWDSFTHWRQPTSSGRGHDSQLISLSVIFLHKRSRQSLDPVTLNQGPP